MRLRAWGMILLLLPLAGCGSSGDGPRLASPTDTSIVPPPTPTTRPLPAPNLSDPGYVTNASWHVGDAWDYHGVGGHYLAVRVVAQAQVGNATRFRTEEYQGTIGNPPNVHYSRWVDASSWLALNRTEEGGLRTLYAPGAPERFLRNGTYRYNETSPGVANALVANVLYTGRPTVTLPWGEVVKAARFEHRIVIEDKSKALMRVLATHVFAEEWGNDLSFQIGESAESYSLVAARYGGRQQGTLTAL